MWLVKIVNLLMCLEVTFFLMESYLKNLPLETFDLVIHLK